ncbi:MULTISPECIES: DUF6245 family protein [Streptomyces]|uniref:DUF6245 family protein n=2 Tax=Streptomyces TaxID=1883 RepID=A0ABV9IM77_9ACTN
MHEGRYCAYADAALTLLRARPSTLAAQAAQLEAAREALETAIGNTDILLNMLKSVGL